MEFSSLFVPVYADSKDCIVIATTYSETKFILFFYFILTALFGTHKNSHTILYITNKNWQSNNNI